MNKQEVVDLIMDFSDQREDYVQGKIPEQLTFSLDRIYALSEHLKDESSTSVPDAAILVEALEKVNPRNTDRTGAEWYKYYGSQVTGEGKESYVHSAACFLACCLAEEELFKKITEVLTQYNAEGQSVPSVGNGHDGPNDKKLTPIQEAIQKFKEISEFEVGNDYQKGFSDALKMVVKHLKGITRKQ